MTTTPDSVDAPSGMVAAANLHGYPQGTPKAIAFNNGARWLAATQVAAGTPSDEELRLAYICLGMLVRFAPDQLPPNTLSVMESLGEKVDQLLPNGATPVGEYVVALLRRAVTP